jgi:hypothetical protein
LGRTIQNLLLSLIGFCGSKGDDTLVLAVGNQTVQRAERLNMNRDPARPSQLDKIRELFVGPKNV